MSRRTPAAALAVEMAGLPGLERTWQGCVRAAFDPQPAHRSKPGPERNALDECKPHEDTYVAALMAARPDDADMPVHGLIITSFITNLLSDTI